MVASGGRGTHPSFGRTGGALIPQRDLLILTDRRNVSGAVKSHFRNHRGGLHL